MKSYFGDPKEKAYQVFCQVKLKTSKSMFTTNYQTWLLDEDVPEIGSINITNSIEETIIDIKRNYTEKELRLLKIQKLLSDEL